MTLWQAVGVSHTGILYSTSKCIYGCNNNVRQLGCAYCMFIFLPGATRVDAYDSSSTSGKRTRRSLVTQSHSEPVYTCARTECVTRSVAGERDRYRVLNCTTETITWLIQANMTSQ